VSEQPDAWIEKVVKVTSALGMNPTRTRWRLIRWQEKRRQAARRREQTLDHIRYEHKTCDECGSVQDRDATVCSRCDAKLGGRTLQVARRIGLVPRSVSVSMLLAIAMLAVYARVLVAQGGGLGSPSAGLLFDFGGNWAPAIADEPWRLVTAVFLHAGLWHIGFNLISTAVIGPQIEELYGRGTMLFLLIVTGVLANILSDATGMDGVGIGASGGISGLVGVGVGYGHRLGTPAGRELRNSMLRWTAYTILFGFAFGADNRAHAGGAIVGAIVGFAVSPRQWLRPRLKLVRILTTSVAAVVALGALAIIFTRTPGEADAATAELSYEPHAMVCRKHFAGDAEGAQHTLKKFELTTSQASIGTMCDQFLRLRNDCWKHEAKQAGGGKHFFEHCPLIEQAFSSFVQQPAWNPYLAQADICRKQLADDVAGAEAAYTTFQPGAANTPDRVELMCSRLLQMREWCRTDPARAGAEPMLHCPLLEKAFSAFP